jgi:hypothetical protein
MTYYNCPGVPIHFVMLTISHELYTAKKKNEKKKNVVFIHSLSCHLTEAVSSMYLCDTLFKGVPRQEGICGRGCIFSYVWHLLFQRQHAEPWNLKPEYLRNLSPGM